VDPHDELTIGQEQQLLTGTTFGPGLPTLAAFKAAWLRHSKRLTEEWERRSVEQEAQDRQHHEWLESRRALGAADVGPAREYTPRAPEPPFAARLLALLKRRPELAREAERCFACGGEGRRAAEGLRELVDGPGQPDRTYTGADE
jgi:hypothetical protein